MGLDEGMGDIRNRKNWVGAGERKSVLGETKGIQAKGTSSLGQARNLAMVTLRNLCL